MVDVPLPCYCIFLGGVGIYVSIYTHMFGLLFKIKVKILKYIAYTIPETNPYSCKMKFPFGVGENTL